MKTMEMNEYQLDGAMFSSNNEADFYGFIQEREDNAAWLATPVAELIVKPGTETVSEIEGRAKTEAKFTVETVHGDYAMRDIATPSLLERARVSGYALGDLTSEDFAEVVNRCLRTSKTTEEAYVRLQDGKAAALMADTYKVLPQPEIYSAADEMIRSDYRGEFISGSWTHRMSTSRYSVSSPTSVYENFLSSKNMSFKEVFMSVSVVTSDTGYSGVNLYPSVVGVMNGGKHFRFPILGELSMPHKGKASIEGFRKNLSLAFAQADDSAKRLKELEKVELNYGFNAFCNVLKKLGIGKKAAAEVIDRFAVIYGNGRATAADIYLNACEIACGIKQDDLMAILKVEEAVSRILKLKNWNEFDRPVNSWSFNVAL